MELRGEDHAEEVKRLRRCINDLVSITSLPAVWTGGDHIGIVRTLVDALLPMLQLNFVYIRLKGRNGEPPLEILRVAPSFEPTIRVQEVSELVDQWLGPSTQHWSARSGNLFGHRDISIASTRMGLRSGIGVLAASASRADFPTDTETLLLNIATNQAAIALQDALLLNEERRLASELDQRIAQRTSELTAANEELWREISERRRAEEALNVRDLQLRLLVDSIAAPLAVMTATGELDVVNAPVLEYFGKTLEELRNWSTIDAVHPDDLARTVTAWQQAIESGEPYDVESRHRRADGIYRWFHVRGFPLRDVNGRIVRWCVLQTDIDDRKRAEEALSASERNLNLIINTIPALVWSARADGAAEFLNQHYLDYIGFTSERARGWGWTTAVHPDDLSGLATAWQTILASGKAGEAEARLRRFDGEYRWFLFRVNPSHDESGRVVKWYGVNTDIAEGKQVETELRLEERRYRELFNSVPVALLEIDSKKRTEMLDDLRRQGVADIEAYLDAHPDFERRAIDASIIREVNQQAVELFGVRDAGALIGASTARLLAMTPGALRSGTVSRFQGEKLFQHELKLQILGRTTDVLLTVARPDISRNFLALTDITQLKSAEDALRRSELRYREAQIELAHANRVATLGQLTASIAHEVSQPIAAMLTNAGTAARWLARQPPNLEKAEQLINYIIGDGKRAADVISGIRDLVKKTPSQRGDLAINEVILETIALTRGDLGKNDILVQTELAPDLPLIQGDRVQMQQVMLNLIMNAVEAMSEIAESSRELMLSTTEVEPDSVLVAVSDSGPGLPPANLARVFDAFYTTKSSGLGMGLSICRSIVEAHGGRLWSKPNEPRGTVFCFTVPIGKKS
jgi:PAS domain S-box-containing protein